MRPSSRLGSRDSGRQEIEKSGEDFLATFFVPEVGFEPTRPFEQSILSAPRLPFRHSGWYKKTSLPNDNARLVAPIPIKLCPCLHVRFEPHS